MGNIASMYSSPQHSSFVKDWDFRDVKQIRADQDWTRSNPWDMWDNAGTPQPINPDPGAGSGWYTGPRIQDPGGLDKEQLFYYKSALQSPVYTQLKSAPQGSLSSLDQFYLDNPQALGQYVTRWGPGDRTQGGNFRYAPEEIAAAFGWDPGIKAGLQNLFQEQQSAGAQDSRSGPGQLSQYLGAIATVALPALGGYFAFGGNAAGLAVGGAGSGGLTAAEAAELGLGVDFVGATEMAGGFGALTAAEAESLGLGSDFIGATPVEYGNLMGTLSAPAQTNESMVTSGEASGTPGLTNNQYTSPTEDVFSPNVNSFTTSNADTYGLNTNELSSGYEGTGISGKAGVGIENSTPQYSWQDKSFFGEPTGTGMGTYPSGVNEVDLANAGTQNLGDYSFQQPQGWGEKVADLYGSAKGSTANDLYNKYKMIKGLGGLYDAYQQKQNAGNLQSKIDQYAPLADPYANERALSSNKWTELTNNPMAAWDQYINGQGREYLQNAAAKYAQAGRRNMMPTMMNSARQNYLTNYLPNYKASVNPTQFAPNSGITGSLIQANQNPNLQPNYMGTIGNAAMNLATSDLGQKALSSIYDWF
jgi:hypothetical protein